MNQPTLSASETIKANGEPQSVLHGDMREYVFKACFGSHFQPWMRIYELNGQHFMTNETGIADAIREHHLTSYYIPMPDGDGLLEQKTTSEQRSSQKVQ
jgi:hypothetical protein